MSKLLMKVKDPYRKVELIAKKYAKRCFKEKDMIGFWKLLDAFFWEAYAVILKEKK